MTEAEEAADLLETMASWFHLDGCEPQVRALIADWRKRGDALRSLIYETTCLSPMKDDGSHWANISAKALEDARLAIGILGSKGEEDCP